MTDPATPQPAYQRIAEHYAEAIRVGQLRPGDRLPSHTDLAAEHQVSEIVIRKAVELLVHRGLLRTVRRKGIYVADPATRAGFDAHNAHNVHVAADGGWSAAVATIDIQRGDARGSVTVLVCTTCLTATATCNHDHNSWQPDPDRPGQQRLRCELCGVDGT